MSYEPNDELVSAYLDGELTPAEQARVERLLADDPHLRQLHEELRALRSSFEALPRHRLNEDLSQRVLRTAERAMLENSVGAADVSAAKPRTVKPQPVKPQPVKHQSAEPSTGKSAADKVELPSLVPRLPRGWRPWLWPAAAIAAALLVMTFNSNKPREIAQVPNPERFPQDASIGARPDATRGTGEIASGRGGSLQPEERSSGPAGESADRSLAEFRSRRAEQAAPAAAMGKTAVMAKSADDAKIGDEDANRSKDGAAAQPFGVAGALSKSQDAQPADAKAVNSATRSLAPAKASATRIERDRSLVEQSKGKSEHPEPGNPAPSPPFQPRPVAAANSATFGQGGRGENALEAQRAYEVSPVVVIHCEITADALRRGALDKLLASHDIRTSQVQRATARVAGSSEKALAKQVDVAPGVLSEAVKESAEKSVDGKKPSSEVYAETSHDQLQLALADMRSQSADFPAVTMEQPIADKFRKAGAPLADKADEGQSDLKREQAAALGLRIGSSQSLRPQPQAGPAPPAPAKNHANDLSGANLGEKGKQADPPGGIKSGVVVSQPATNGAALAPQIAVSGQALALEQESEANAQGDDRPAGAAHPPMAAGRQMSKIANQAKPGLQARSSDPTASAAHAKKSPRPGVGGATAGATDALQGKRVKAGEAQGEEKPQSDENVQAEEKVRVVFMLHVIENGKAGPAAPAASQTDPPAEASPAPAK